MTVAAAPARWSALAASAGAGVRTRPRRPRRGRPAPRRSASARTLPRPTTTTWSAMSSSSPIRWLDTSIGRPSAASERRKLADPDDPLGVHAVERLVQDQHRRVAEHGGGDPEPLAHPERVAARLAPRRAGRGRPARSPRRPGWRSCSGSGPSRAGGCVRCGWAGGRRRRPARRRGAAGAAAVGTAWPPTSARPSSGASRPRITRMVVDLPAPLGPTKPVTVPGATVKVMPSRARVEPNRLRSPVTSMVVRSLSSSVLRRWERSEMVVRHGRCQPGGSR